MMKCAVIDDEPLARECISDYVGKVDFLELMGEGSNPIELAELLDKHEIDLIFLDIQMPMINGIDFLKSKKGKLPLVILTTAYPSYALEGYELDVLDYLLKPITFGRFFQACTKAKEYFQIKQKSETAENGTDPELFFIKCDHRIEKILKKEIRFIQALQNYVTIHTTDNQYMTLINMKSVEQNLDSDDFIRVHKSYIVSKRHIRSIENQEIVMDADRIPISRNLRETVLNQVLGDKMWKR